MLRETIHRVGERLSHIADETWDDVRHSARSLVRERWIASIVIALLTLGIGVNLATFEVADELFLRPPEGVVHPHDLRRLVLRTNWSVGHAITIRSDFSYAAYARIRDALARRAVAAGYSRPDSAHVRIADTDRFAQVSYVTSDFFETLGVPFVLGRSILPSEAAMAQGQAVAVISYDLWQQCFGGRHDALGKAVDVSGRRYIIIGVTGRGFSGIDLDRNDIWVPLAMFPWPPSQTMPWYTQWRMNLIVRIVTRLNPRENISAIAAMATGAFRVGEAENVKTFGDTAATVLASPLAETLGPFAQSSNDDAIAKRLPGVSLLVLVIAVANVANILLLRIVRKSREIAVRRALGVTRLRFARQCFIESLLLTTAAAAASIAVGATGAAITRSMLFPRVHWPAGTLSVRLLLFSAGLSILTGIAAGLLPALWSFDRDLSASLKPSVRGGTHKRSLTRIAFSALQVGLSMVLLISAGLFIKSIDAVRAIQLGYDVDRLVIGSVVFRDPNGHFIDESSAHKNEIATGLAVIAQRLNQTRMTDGVALSWSAPLSRYAMVPVFTADRQPVPRLQERSPALLRVSPEYFAVTGVRLVRGRTFTTSDEESGEPMILVNQTAARIYWAGKEAIGQCLFVVRLSAPCSRVIGVTRDAHLENIIEGPTAEIFQPMRLGARQLSSPSVIIARARRGHTDAVVTELRRELGTTFPSADPPQVETVGHVLEPETRAWRLGAELLSAVALLALTIATVGVFSVLAFSVNQRKYEFGVRMALGATNLRIATLVLRASISSIGAGLAIGIGLTLAGGQILQSLLYATKVTDPAVIAGAAGILILAVLTGSAAPAYRATRASAAAIMRTE